MALVGEEHGAAAARPAAHDVQILHVNLNLNLIYDYVLVKISRNMLVFASVHCVHWYLLRGAVVLLVAESEPAAGAAAPGVDVAVAAHHDHVLVPARHGQDVHAQQGLHQLRVSDKVVMGCSDLLYHVEVGQTFSDLMP